MRIRDWSSDVCSSDLYIVEPVGGDEVRRNAQRHAIRSVDPPAGRSQPDAAAARQARQEPAAANIGEQADAGLWHGKDGALGGDAIARRKRQVAAPARGAPVTAGHQRLLIIATQKRQKNI